MSSVRFEWNGQALTDAVLQAAGRANYENAIDLAGRAAQLAPIEDEDLRGSLLPDGAGSRFEAQDGGLSMWVGSDLPYAKRQHEDLSLRHRGPEHGKVDGGQAKYLEQPLGEMRETYLTHIAEAAGSVIRS